MMAFIWLVTVIFGVPQSSGANIRIVMQMLVVLTASNLAILLAIPDPSKAWQTFTGIGVSSKYPAEVVSDFEKLVTTQSPNMVRIYIFSTDANDAVLSSIVFYDTLMGIHTPPLSVDRPVDWVRPTEFRLNEIRAAKYLIVNPKQAKQAPVGPALHNFWQEQGAFTAWVDKLSIDDGTLPYLTSPTVRIVKVKNPIKLRASLAHFVAHHRWDRDFMLQNHLENH